MKTIGMIGGTGWLSTLEYYRIINQETNKRLGGLNSAKIILSSFNYAEIDKLNKVEDNSGVYKLVVSATEKLKRASADFIILCANTLHQYADNLEKETGLKIVHIADATAVEIKKKGLTKIGLLGTKFTMEMDFYTKKLRYSGIESLIPEKPEREYVHNAIMNELLKEEFKEKTKAKFLKIINDLEQKGAQGIVLGCTEIPLLIKQDDTHLPVFNTLEIHAKAAVDFALK
ncbi:MAG: aspartate/glutamate racemase family protein [Ignavibacteriaceae bacterium]|jgi:aspartate racemase|nr:aspartate/glutamate racemase family protein [Ignavibacteriaceae bacterium]MCW8824498.1 aspartate/glutamate racemase family protein [Ignavibacteriaceae bacterium]MCW8960582.1 aspartate/glutamate racemase family protein [Ignavibacteriaceae bacterium]MCW8995714.1 aspartate/glutamate racemase family protein [Psychromonas sp.]MCW9095791.1 aspartate/glutamate racemase family protein [Ignavibacteriaceae bacterium]